MIARNGMGETMDTPEEKERRKYRWELFERRWKLMPFIELWLWAALFTGFFILSLLF